MHPSKAVHLGQSVAVSGLLLCHLSNLCPELQARLLRASVGHAGVESGRLVAGVKRERQKKEWGKKNGKPFGEDNFILFSARLKEFML